MATMTKQGARQVTETLDRIANLFQTEANTLGVNPRIANDFALRCDMLADHIEKRAGLKTAAPDALGLDMNAGDTFDPSDIGRETAGPLEMIDSDEPWMQGEFTQQENRELADLQEGGELGPVVDGPRAPTPGKQASAKKVAAVEVFTLPGMTKQQFNAQMAALAANRRELDQIVAENKAILDKIKTLEGVEKAALDQFKDAGAALKERGKTLAKAEEALLQFEVKNSTSVPGIEQLMADEATKSKYERYGDLYNKVAAKLGDDAAKIVADLIAETKADLTVTKQITAGMKLVVTEQSAKKTAAFQNREAGLFDIVGTVLKNALLFKKWMVDSAKAIVSRMTGNNKKAETNVKALTALLDSGSDKLLGIENDAKAAGKTASHGFNLTAK